MTVRIQKLFAYFVIKTKCKFFEVFNAYVCLIWFLNRISMIVRWNSKRKQKHWKLLCWLVFSVGRSFILSSGWITRIFDAHTVRLFDAVFKHRRNCCKSVIIFVVSAPVVHFTYAFSTVSRKMRRKKNLQQNRQLNSM